MFGHFGREEEYLPGKDGKHVTAPTALFTGEREEEQTLVIEKKLYKRRKRG